MAYCGFEQFTFAFRVGSNRRGGLGQEETEQIHGSSEIAPIIEPPSGKLKSIRKWMEQGEEEALDFLGASAGDRKIFAEWISERKSIEVTLKAALLAKAFRNCTLHGTLSASKIKQFGLGKAIKRLPGVLAEMVEVTCDRMMSQAKV